MTSDTTEHFDKLTANVQVQTHPLEDWNSRCIMQPSYLSLFRNWCLRQRGHETFVSVICHRRVEFDTSLLSLDDLTTVHQHGFGFICQHYQIRRDARERKTDRSRYQQEPIKTKKKHCTIFFPFEQKSLSVGTRITFDLRLPMVHRSPLRVTCAMTHDSQYFG